MKRFTGILFFWVGITLILNSFSSITGYIITENISKNISGIWGLVFIIVGIFIFLKLEDITTIYDSRQTKRTNLKPRKSLREHNKQAQIFAKKAYHKEYGKNPTQQELKKYIRQLHEKGELHEIIEYQKRTH